MPAMVSYTDSKAFIEYALGATRSRMRLVQITSALAATFTLAVIMVTVLVTGDHFIDGGLPASLRMAMRWVMAVGLGGMAAASVIYPLARRRSDLHTARAIEKAHPQLHDSLTASVQLAGDERLPKGVLAAVRRFAASQAGDIDFASSISTARLRNCGMALGAAVFVLTVYWMASPKAVWPSLRRIFGDDALAAPARTQIVILQPEASETVPAGKPVKFLVDIRKGDGPAMLKIARDGENYHQRDTIEMIWIGAADAGAERYVAYWPRASAKSGAVRFKILCGDAVSEQRDLIVLAEPLVRGLRATLRWPEYTGRGQEHVRSPHIEALPGTRVRLEAAANHDLQRASLVFRRARPAIMTTSKRKLSAEFTVTRDDSYRIEYRGRHELVRCNSIWYPIKALADEPPRVRLTRPAGRIKLAVNETLILAGEASDDYGLVEMVLVCAGPDGEQTYPLAAYEHPGRVSARINAAVPVASLGKARRRLRCYVAAKDLCPQSDGRIGQIGRSDEFELVITAARANPLDESQIAAEELTAPRREESQADDLNADRPGESEKDDASPNGSKDASTPDATGPEQLTRLDADRLDVIRKHLAPDQSPASNEGAKESGRSPKPAPAGQDGKPSTDKGAKESGRSPKPAPADQHGDGQPKRPAGQDGKESPSRNGQRRPADSSGAGSGQSSPGEGGGKPGSTGGGSTSQPAGAPNSSGDKPAGGASQGNQPSPASLLNRARRQLRDGKVDPKLLKELNMTEQQFRKFIDRYSRLIGKGKSSPSHSQPGKKTKGSSGDAGPVGDATGSEKPDTHKLRLNESRTDKVTPEYRDAVMDYLRAVSGRRKPTEPRHR